MTHTLLVSSESSGICDTTTMDPLVMEGMMPVGGLAHRSSSNGVPVPLFPATASPYGALDMAGNVFEWVHDWYEQRYCRRSPGRNPPGPERGAYKAASGSQKCRGWSGRFGGEDGSPQAVTAPRREPAERCGAQEGR